MGNCCSQTSSPYRRTVKECHPLKSPKFSSSPIWTSAPLLVSPLTFLSGNDDGLLTAYDYSSFSLSASLQLSNPILRLSTPIIPSPTIFSAGRNCAASIYSYSNDSFTHVHTFPKHNSSVLGLCCARDGSWVCSGSRDYSLTLFDSQSLETLASAKPSRNVVTDMASFSGDSNSELILQTSEDLKINIWDTDLKFINRIDLPDFFGTSITSLGQNHFGTVLNGFDGEGGEIYVYDFRNLSSPCVVFSGHDQRGNCICQYNSTRFLSVGSDLQLKLWSFNDLSETCLSAVSLPSIPLSVTRVDDVVVVGCADGDVVLFEVTGDTLVEKLRLS
ncbi:hypothetical protein GEMRC1_006634 [Eukaryota sp. GEM-RC1]